MKVEQKILNHFDELINSGEKVLQTKHSVSIESFGSYQAVDESASYQWGMKCLHLLENLFGITNSLFTEFKKLFNDFDSISGYDSAKKALAVLKAARDNYENNYLFDTRTLIEAEVFDDFLEQAEQLFDKGYYQPAAVIAGCVLEDGLRKLCDKNGITFPKKPTIDPMNVELAKAGIYNKLWQKKITALADLRNKAAHGEWDEFEKDDVKDMIRDVRRFMEDYFV